MASTTREGTTNAVHTVMLTMKDTRKLLRTAIRMIPEIPYVNEKRPSVLPFVLGAVGVAVAGGIVALFVFSPKTRTRALGIAKDTYGKVQDQIAETPIGERLGVHKGENGLANGISVSANS